MATEVFQEPLIQSLIEQIAQNPNTFSSFRLVSRYFRAASEPVFYRHLPLYDRNEDESANNLIHSIVQRILDPDDQVRKYVRRLDIGPFNKDGPNLPQVLDSHIIVRILHSFTNMQDFGWNVCSKMPAAILTTLHERWPSSYIHVRQPYRYERELDKNLLASPQLISLQMQVYVNISIGVSDWPILMELLIRHGSLRSFRPHTEYVDGWTSGAPGPLHMVPGIKILALEDFDVPAKKGIEPEEMHIDNYMSAISWSSLRRLDLGYGETGNPIFKELIGRVPQLKCLSFRLILDHDRGLLEQQHDIMVAFFKSIDSLEEISIVNDVYWHYIPLWLAILQSHAKTLRKLNVKRYISDAIVDVIAKEGSALEDFSLPICDRYATEHRLPFSTMENLPVDRLTRLTRLRFLKLVIKIRQPSAISFEADVSNANYFQKVQLREDLARDFVTSLVKAFSDCIDTLERVKVTFQVGDSPTWKYVKWTFTAYPQTSGSPKIRLRKKIIGHKDAMFRGTQPFEPFA